MNEFKAACGHMATPKQLGQICPECQAMSELTCRSCVHSRYQPGPRLWCALHKGPCVRKCPQFVYEPGTDEE